MRKVRPSSATTNAPKRQRELVRQRVKEFNSAIKPVEFTRQIDHMSYKQARRLHGPIYKVLSQELYEESCSMAADYFNCLVLKEQKLYALTQTRVHVSDYPKFLCKLHENVILAEKAGKLKQSGGILACLRILHQSLKLFEGKTEQLDWLLQDLHLLFIDIAEKYAKKDPNCNEVRAHLYCSYANFLSKQNKIHYLRFGGGLVFYLNSIFRNPYYEDYENCLEYFQKTLELCRGANWPPENNQDRHKFATLHEFVAINCTRKMKNYAITFQHINPEFAMEMLKKALLIFAEVDNPNDQSIQNRVLLCECLVLQARLLVEAKQFTECEKQLNKVMDRVDPALGDDYMRLMCEIYVLNGICLINRDEFSAALEMFQKSLVISKKLDLPMLRGRALLRMGELYSKLPSEKLKAIKAYQEAKNTFSQLKNPFYMRRVSYGLARVLAKDIFPNVLKAMKNSSDDPCSLYNLRKWKYQLKAPWTTAKKFTTLQSTITLNVHQSVVSMFREYNQKMYASSETSVVDEMLRWHCNGPTEMKVDIIDQDCVLNEED